MSVPTKIIGTLLIVYLALALLFSCFLLTGLDGVYDFFSLKCVMISDNFLDGEISPRVERGTLAVFSKDDSSSDGDVVLATVSDGYVVGRVMNVPGGKYLGFDNVSAYYSASEYDIEGVLSFTDGFLYDLIDFSLEFYGVLVLFALPVIANVVFILFVVSKKYRSRS